MQSPAILSDISESKTVQVNVADSMCVNPLCSASVVQHSDTQSLQICDACDQPCWLANARTTFLPVLMQLTVRDGRVKRTETIHNSTHPEWNEELQFIVDDPDNQSISVVVKDDDIFDDTVSFCLSSFAFPSCVVLMEWHLAVSLFSRKIQEALCFCCAAFV